MGAWIIFVLPYAISYIAASFGHSYDVLNQEFVTEWTETLLQNFASNHSQSGLWGITPAEFSTALETLTSHSPHFIHNLLGTCDSSLANCSWKDECPGIPEIFYNLAIDGVLDVEGFIGALPVALNTLNSKSCARGFEDATLHLKHKTKPSTAEAWGYSIGFSSLIIVISNIGICLGPIMERKFFKRLLQFLVAMGAGSLASTGLLVLIPEAFDIMSVEEMGNDYIWKASVAIISIYVFFSLERILKTCLYNRAKDINDISNSLVVENSGVDIPLTTNNENSKGLMEKKELGHGHSHGFDENHNDRITLAWMVMSGDVIHNFVDGLSIGAAFTEDITLGINISLAIICEELPHELADIAILLHSGLSIKKSLLVNFLSACVCYVGLIIGVILGSNIAAASKWIFAIAGGLFLYVPLVDMLPDMRNHLDSLLIYGGREARIVACLHTGGLLIGAAIIIFIVNISSLIVI
ncbi:zinc transporter ZIP14 [Biomphalaria pfeifferi]|nr:zinc transporter ZIP14 [Biomphalaria pfeifferi]